MSLATSSRLFVHQISHSSQNDIGFYHPDTSFILMNHTRLVYSPCSRHLPPFSPSTFLKNSSGAFLELPIHVHSFSIHNPEISLSCFLRLSKKHNQSPAQSKIDIIEVFGILEPVHPPIKFMREIGHKSKSECSSCWHNRLMIDKREVALLSSCQPESELFFLKNILKS